MPKHAAHDMAVSTNDALTGRATRQFQREVFTLEIPGDAGWINPGARLGVSAGQTKLDVPARVGGHKVSVAAQTSSVGNNGEIGVDVGPASLTLTGFDMSAGSFGGSFSASCAGPGGSRMGMDFMHWRMRGVRDRGSSRHAPERSNEETRCVEMRDNTATSLSAKSRLPATFGASIRGDAVCRSEASLRLNRPLSAARELLKHSTPPAGMMPTLTTCVGDLLPGDEFEENIVTTFHGSACCGAASAHVGGQALVESEARITVRKLDDATVQVMCRPRVIRAVRGIASQDYGVMLAAGPIDICLDILDFTIKLPEGQATLDSLLRGELPLDAVTSTDLTPEGVTEAFTRLSGWRNHPAPGVQTKVVGQVRAKFHHETAGILWRFLPQRVRDLPGLCLLGYEESRGIEQIVKVAPDNVSVTRAAVHDHAVRDAWRGTLRLRSELVQRWAGERRADGEVEPELAGVVLRCRVMSDNQRTKRLQSLFVAPFERISGSHCPCPQTDGLAHSLMAVRTIGATDFDSLASRVWAPGEVERCAEDAGVDVAPILKLIEELRALERQRPRGDAPQTRRVWLLERIACLERFAQTMDLGAFVLHRLLPDSRSSAIIASDIPDVQRLALSAEQLALKASTRPLTATTPLSQVCSHFAETSAQLRDLDTVQRQLVEDPIMVATARDQAIATVEQAKDKLRAALDMSAKDMQALRTRLSKKLWLTSAQRDILTYIDGKLTPPDLETWRQRFDAGGQALWGLLDELYDSRRLTLSGRATAQRCLFLAPSAREKLAGRYEVQSKRASSIIKEIFGSAELCRAAWQSLGRLWWTRLTGWHIWAMTFLPFLRR